VAEKLLGQTNLRLSQDLQDKFHAEIERGNYCKSSILRTLIAEWCDEQARKRGE